MFMAEQTQNSLARKFVVTPVWMTHFEFRVILKNQGENVSKQGKFGSLVNQNLKEEI